MSSVVKIKTMKGEQLSLFSEPGAKPKTEPKAHEPEPLAVSAPLNASSSLEAAITTYHEQMKKQNLSKRLIYIRSKKLYWIQTSLNGRLSSIFQKYILIQM